MNYLLVGDESYNLRTRKEEIINKVLPQHDELSVSIYRGQDEIDLLEVIGDCQIVPFLSDNKVVILENPTFLADGKVEEKDWEALLDYLKSPCEFTTFIIYYDGNIAKSNSLVKELNKYLKYETYNSLSLEEFGLIVKRDLNENNIKLDDRTINELLNRLPNNIENWKQELEKLKLYPNKINKEVINDLICKPLEDNVFELSNAVTDKNMAKAINVYNDLLINNKNDIPSLIGLLASQFRFMSQSKILQENGLSNKAIADELLAKPYRVQKSLEACGRKNSTDIMSILNDLSQLDQDIKSGRIDAASGLELFIIKNTRK